MTNVLGRPLRILVAEDDALIAFDLVDALEMFGCVAAGPVATVKAALEHAEDPTNAIDGALLDLDLRGQRSYPVAAALMRRNIPFAFTSGYGTRSDRGGLSRLPLPAEADQSIGPARCAARFSRPDNRREVPCRRIWATLIGRCERSSGRGRRAPASSKP